MVTPVGADARRALQERARPLDTAALQSLSPMLIVVPHADDEVLGCGGLIAEASDLKLEIRIVYLTDGAASHRGSPTWSPARLASIRRQEALQALGVLGALAEQVLFLDWPDAAPHAETSEAFAGSVAAIIRWAARSPPRSLWAPYAGERHCDHQAAWALATAIRHRWKSAPPALFEYLVWGWNEFGIAETLRGRAVWSLPCAHQIGRRRRALACHATQLGELILDADEAFELPDSLTALVESSSQIFVEG